MGGIVGHGGRSRDVIPDVGVERRHPWQAAGQKPPAARPDRARMIARWRVAGVEFVGFYDPELGWKWGTARWAWPWQRVGIG